MDYYKLDEKDIVILENLSKNSREKLSVLAEKLQTSIPTIRSRIDKLEALGIIQHFSIVLSYDLLSDHPCYFILVKASPNSINSLLEVLDKKDEILELHELIGTYQIYIKTIPLSMHDFQVFITNLRELEGIIELNPMPLATTYKQEISKLPSQEIQVKLRCEYCNKVIEKDYQTLNVDEVTHFFCCKSCLANYEQDLNNEN